MSKQAEVALARGLAAKPAIKQALELLAAGRMIIFLDHDGQCAYVDEVDKVPVRDGEGRKLVLPGGYTLYRAEFLDQFGLVTKAGREFLNGQG